MHQRRFFLRMSFYDNEGHTYGERAIEIDSAWCGKRYAELKPPSSYVPGTISFDDTVEIMEIRELRRKEFVNDARRMGEALADHLEDKEGWHGTDRQERANSARKD